jgi:hypothetical protein
MSAAAQKALSNGETLEPGGLIQRVSKVPRPLLSLLERPQGPGSDRNQCDFVSIALYGERIEIDFSEDHIEYSRFTGGESVKDDQSVLFKLIAEFVD